MTIEEFLNWLLEVERVFECMDVEENRRVKIVIMRFRGSAIAWWDHTVENRARAQRRPVRTWGKLKKLMKARVLPHDYKEHFIISTINADKAQGL